MEIINGYFKVNVSLPKSDFSGFDYNTSELIIKTEFRPDSNDFTFKCKIPTYIFNGVKDSSDNYLTNPPKPERSFERRGKKFTQNLSSITLASLLADLRTICVDALELRERETAKSEKYIAIRFRQSNTQQKDDFNFASMGHSTKSEFQFFIVHKVIKNPNSLDQYNFKSDKLIVSNFGLNNVKRDGWYWYGVGVVEKYQLVKWTQEREDYLTSIQDKFVSMNNMLDSFLGDINDDKLIELMNNTNFLLGSGE